LGTIGGLRWRQFTRPAPVIEATAAPAQSPAPQPAAPAPVPSAAQVAAAPHPAVETSDDPQPTETGKAVVEEEPVAPLAANDPPPANPNPREEVTVTALATPQPEPAATPPQPEPAPAPAPKKSSLPEWQRVAVTAPATGGKPMIAVIIDDMGLDRKRSEQILALPGPLTISFMSYAEELAKQSAEAKAHGDELMMHVPMEPLDPRMDPGPGALFDKLTPEEVRQTFESDLGKFSGYVGINNHMGSKFTANEPGMEVVMQALRERGLLFIDSLTTDKSVGLAVARRYGVPSAGRNVFLDNAGDIISVDFELNKREEVARTKGNAIAIGHPRDATIAALAKWLPTLQAKGFVLVPVTAIVKARWQSAAQSAQASH
jgi:uncharacterized protein